MSAYKKETICIQSGWKPKSGEPRVLPIYQSTTFKYEDSEQMGRLFDLEESGYFYSRLQNPTNDCVAAKICELEGGVAAMLTSSGQAANYYAVFNICEAGDHVVMSSTVYGGSFNLITCTMNKMGITCTVVDPDAPAQELEKAFRENTKCVFAETIANPALVVLDIEKFAALAHAHHVPLIVDNTFATPINCNPFRWGADIVTHSTSKYMDGHAMAWAAGSWVPGILTGRRIRISFRDSVRRTSLITALSTRKNSGRRPISRRQPASSCGIWGLPSRRRMRFC